MHTEMLGKNQKTILRFFKDSKDGKDVATIKELAIYLFCLWDGTQPTKEQINEVHRIVRSLKKKGLVKTWFVKRIGSRKTDFKWKWHPNYYKLVALRDYKGPYDVVYEE